MSSAWDYVKWVAKVISAVAGIIIAAVLGGQLDLDPEWVVVLQAIVAGAGVFVTKNGPDPSGE